MVAKSHQPRCVVIVERWNTKTWKMSLTAINKIWFGDKSTSSTASSTNRNFKELILRRDLNTSKQALTGLKKAWTPTLRVRPAVTVFEHFRPDCGWW